METNETPDVDEIVAANAEPTPQPPMPDMSAALTENLDAFRELGLRLGRIEAQTTLILEYLSAFSRELTEVSAEVEAVHEEVQETEPQTEGTLPNEPEPDNPPIGNQRRGGLLKMILG